MRQLDQLITDIITHADSALRTLFPPKQRPHQRTNPGLAEAPPSMTSQEKHHVAGLMRVNHAGEVCAQALYQGQALTAKLPLVKEQMIHAAEEEIDHLAWCEQRLQELDSQPSKLSIIWYSGSFILGALAGLAGDRWSLGFVAETERQVADHLQKHLTQLPIKDQRTRAILSQMQEDEAQHAQAAIVAGAAELPQNIKSLMTMTSKLMTCSSYYI